MVSTIDGLNFIVAPMKSTKSQACEAWQLLVKFFFTQRADLPTLVSEFELSPAQCHVLHLINPDRPMPMGQLAEALACDASNVTGLVDRLESRGLIRRQASAADRRVRVLELTPAGVRLRSTVLDRMTKPPESLDRLSIDEQRALVRILKRLLAC
jgi:DNA-binding MarR family transcriptional regulator